MKLLKVTPLRFEKYHGTLQLVSRVEHKTRSGRWTAALWYSAHDVSVEQLVAEVREHFKADTVDFQIPLLALGVREYHAGDYLQ